MRTRQGPDSRFRSRRRQFPLPVNIAPDGGPYCFTSIDTIRSAFLNSRNSSLSLLKPPSYEGTEAFSLVFTAMSVLDGASWRPKKGASEVVRASQAELAALLASQSSVEIVN